MPPQSSRESRDPSVSASPYLTSRTFVFLIASIISFLVGVVAFSSFSNSNLFVSGPNSRLDVKFGLNKEKDYLEEYEEYEQNENFMPSIRHDIHGSESVLFPKFVDLEFCRHVLDNGYAHELAETIEPIDIMSSPELLYRNHPPTKQDNNQHLEFERIHLVLLYDTLERSYFCVLESILKSLDTKSSPTTDVEIFIWVKSIDLIQRSAHLKSIIAGFQKRILDIQSRGVSLKFKEVDFLKSISGTPLFPFFHCAEEYNVDLGQYEAFNKGDAIRLALLYKLGGLYLDADFVVTNDLTALEQGLAQEQKDGFNGAVMKFTRNAKQALGFESWRFLDLMMKEYVESYDQQKWAWVGPHLITRIAKRNCNVFDQHNKKDPNKAQLVECHDAIGKFSFTQWGISRVYTIPWWDKADKMKPVKYVEKKYSNNFKSPEESVMVHLWHHASIQMEETSCESQILDPKSKAYISTFVGSLREEFCPLVLHDMFSNSDCSF